MVIHDIWFRIFACANCFICLYYFWLILGVVQAKMGNFRIWSSAITASPWALTMICIGYHYPHYHQETSFYPSRSNAENSGNRTLTVDSATLFHFFWKYTELFVALCRGSRFPNFLIFEDDFCLKLFIASFSADRFPSTGGQIQKLLIPRFLAGLICSTVEKVFNIGQMLKSMLFRWLGIFSNCKL